MSKPIDPWELLREARETLHDFAENFDCDGDSHKYNTTCRACDAAKQRDRIDAALAARNAGMNCGKGCPDCGHPYGGLDYCQGDGHDNK